MQIHELTQRTVTEASIADRIKSAATAVKTGMQNVGDSIAANNAAQASAQQQKIQAQAAKYAQTLQRRGYGTAATAPAPATPAQPTAAATVAPAGPVAAPQSAGPVNTNQLQAGAVALNSAPAVMLAGDFNAALSQLKLNTNHVKELKDKLAQDASFKNAFLKALGLAK